MSKENVVSGYNPYRDWSTGRFASADKVVEQFNQIIARAEELKDHDIVKKFIKERNDYIEKKLPDSELGQKILKEKYSYIPVANKNAERKDKPVKTKFSVISSFDPREHSAETVIDTPEFTVLNEATETEISKPNSDVDPEFAVKILKKRGEVTQKLTEESDEAWIAFREAEAWSDEKEAARDEAVRRTQELKSYRHRTSNFLEKMNNSFGYSDLKQWGHDSIGDTVKTTSHSPNTREWLEERLDSVGGSDVGILAVEKLLPKEEQAKYHANNFMKMKQSKIRIDESEVKQQTESVSPASEKQAKTIGYNPDAEPVALYWGNASESYIAKSFERDRGNRYEVYEAKDQFINKEKKYQKINVDGILVDKKTEEKGILEIKNIAARPYPPEADSNGWSNPDTDLSPNYRAQILYYLNATGYKFGVVRVRYNDNEFRDFYINSDDDVIAGSGVKIDEFLKDHVEPFYYDSKRKREAFNRHTS